MNDNVDIKIIKNYQIIKKVGKGAYGQVWKCINKKKKHICALKRIFDAFRNVTDCQHTYREIMYLKQLEHPNIIRIYNYQKSLNQKDMYIQMQFVQSDLLTALKNQYLKDIQKEYIFTQCVSAIYYLHSGNLIHRDIKPSNILVGSNCQAKLCDFGLIRGLNSYENESNVKLTDNIATRWYKAPQLLLSSCNYGKQIDIWSLGCLLAELYLSKPLFQGTSTFNQLQKIIQITGIPAVDKLSEIIRSQTSLAVLRSFINDCSGSRNVYTMQTKTKRQSLCYLSTGQSKQQSSQSQQSVPSNYNKLLQIIPSINTLNPSMGSTNNILDLLTKMLQFDPRRRLKIEQIIQHPYFSKFRNKVQLKKIQKAIKIKYQNRKLGIEEYKKLLNNKMRISNNFIINTTQNQTPQTLLGRKLSNDKYPRKSLDRKKKSKSVNKSTNQYEGASNEHSRPKQKTKNTNSFIEIQSNSNYQNRNKSNTKVSISKNCQNNKNKYSSNVNKNKQIGYNNGMYKFNRIDNEQNICITHNTLFQKQKITNQQYITTYINTVYPQNQPIPRQNYVQKSLKSIKSAKMDTNNPARAQQNNMLYSYQDTKPYKYNGQWYSPQNSAWKQIPKQIERQKSVSISGNKSQNKSISDLSNKSQISNNSQISSRKYVQSNISNQNNSNNFQHISNANVNKINVNSNNFNNFINVPNNQIKNNDFDVKVTKKSNISINIPDKYPPNPTNRQPNSTNPYPDSQSKVNIQPRINRQSYEKPTKTIQQIRNMNKNNPNPINNNNNSPNPSPKYMNPLQATNQISSTPSYIPQITKTTNPIAKNQTKSNINNTTEISNNNSNNKNQQSDNILDQKQTRNSLYTNIENRTNIHGSKNDLSSVFVPPDNTLYNNYNTNFNTYSYNLNVNSNLYQGITKKQKVNNNSYPFQQVVGSSVPTTTPTPEIRFTGYQIPVTNITTSGSPRFESFQPNNSSNYKTSLSSFNGYSGFSPTFQNNNIVNNMNKGNFVNIMNKNIKNGNQGINYKQWKRN